MQCQPVIVLAWLNRVPPTFNGRFRNVERINGPAAGDRAHRHAHARARESDMEDKDMFGEDTPVEEVADTVEQQELEPVEQVIPTAEAQPLATPVVEAKPEPGFVPITVVLDEREKRKALEAQLLQYQQQPREQPQMPDPVVDPDGYNRAQAQYAANQALNVKLELSEDVARDKFGDDLVDKARDWALQLFSQNPGFQNQVFAQRNPYKFVVEQYQREQIASQVSLSDFEQFQAWKAAQAQMAPAPAAPVQQAATVPISLANAPSAGSPKPPKADPVAEKLATMF